MKYQILWNDRFAMGVNTLDKEHKLLFLAMDKLLRLNEDEDKSEWACREAVKFLKHHCVEHFEHEEEYMRSISYADAAIHKRLHDDFKDQTLPALEQELEALNYSKEAIRHFLGVSLGWLVAHTLTEDMALVGKKKSRWQNIAPGHEKEALDQVITPLFQEIFHMKAKLISGQYAGENFGKVMCCRFIYRGQDKKRWEIILVYEEQLILKILSDILNVECSRIDAMGVDVLRYISRQFLNRTRESFPTLEEFVLDKESMLTHEQLLDAFEREWPTCSLLFDTGMGYFGFCAFSAEHARGKEDIFIDPQNAINVVDRYLTKEKQEWKNQRQKILIVDDSDFFRASMTYQLKEHYEILEASSGVAAIQSIVLHKPDLVLLDYEMPVCDGRQVLEMIRSEKSLRDTPIIFLTGRGDRESVKQVSALKPDGYLLKSMSDAEIKKGIREFFAKKENREGQKE